MTAERTGTRVVELHPSDPLLDMVYRQILVPSFPPEEMVTHDELVETVDAGSALVSALVAEDGEPVAGAVGDWWPDSRIMLLSYLAVRAGHRAHGYGGELLRQVVTQWRAARSPVAIVAELEHPARHRASAAYGDPAARLRFYHRHGTRALALPYFQPALGAAGSRVPGMLLAAVDLAPGALCGPDRMDPEPVRRFLADYLVACEGRVPDDPATVALFDATGQPGGIRLLPLDRPDQLPH